MDTNRQRFSRTSAKARFRIPFVSWYVAFDSGNQPEDNPKASPPRVVPLGIDIAKATGRLAKTDHLDTLLLADYGNILRPDAMLSWWHSLRSCAEEGHLPSSSASNALNAIRGNPVLSPFYQPLRARGKSHRVAITAVRHKFLVHLNQLMHQYSHLSLASQPS